MYKKRITVEEKINAVHQYLDGKASQGEIAEYHGISKRSVQQWIYNFESMGADAFPYA